MPKKSRSELDFSLETLASRFFNRIEHDATDQNHGNVANQKIDGTARPRAMVVVSDPSQKYASVPNRRRAVVAASERKGDDRHREREENEVPVAIVIRAAQR